MKRRIIFILTIFICTIYSTSTAQSVDKLITRESVYSQIAFLSCDEMRGRFAGSSQGRMAAEYIIQHFRSLKVKPFSGNSYCQPFSRLIPGPDLSWDNVQGETMMNNVIGMIEGKKKDEYIVIGAHFDHIGTTYRAIEGDSICNGADDNASGTTAVLQLAKAFAEQDFKPERTILFALWDGEELMLLGSKHFISTFPDPQRIKAYVNFDMIGRYEERGDSSNFSCLYTTGYPEFERWMRKGIKRYKLDLPTYFYTEDKPSQPSDQIPFVSKGIPAICFHTDCAEDMHKPSDEVEKINIEKMTDIIKAAYYVVKKLAAEPIK